MPLYIPNILFEDCWGSMGNISFYHRDGKCYWKTKPKTVFPGTSAQLANAAIHKRAIKSWKDLNHDEQLEWSAIARKVPSKRLPYDTETYISGYNLFVSAYHGFAQLGDEHTPHPKPYKPFPQFSITFLSAIQIEEDLLLSFNTLIPELTPHVMPDLIGHLTADDPHVIPSLTGHLRPVLKLHLTHPSGGIRPGLMRSFLSMCSDDTSRRIFIHIPNYKTLWKLDTPVIADPNHTDIPGTYPTVIAGLTGNLPQYQAHIRYFLIDSETGYRSREQHISVRFEV